MCHHFQCHCVTILRYLMRPHLIDKGRNSDCVIVSRWQPAVADCRFRLLVVFFSMVEQHYFSFYVGEKIDDKLTNYESST